MRPRQNPLCVPAETTGVLVARMPDRSDPEKPMRCPVIPVVDTRKKNHNTGAMAHPYADIPEIFQAGDSIGMIRIPCEQDVPFTPRIRAIVDSAEFQRLRYVTQLALSSRVYPGATHTRFEHALGVYHNALRYLRQLGHDKRFAETVSVREAEILIVAALLHDVGHWPFCHPIEDLSLPEMPPHESFAGEFLGQGSELASVLREHWGIEPEEVLDVLVARHDSASHRLRRSILSGPIDIDKMDYLARDSQHCGVPYGKHFDRSRLISSLIVNESGDGLAITSKGRTAAEMMVFARYVMFTEVYWHHAVRSATSMFARAFFEVHGTVDLAQLFRMQESDLIRSLCQAAVGTTTAALTDGLFGARRSLHKRLAEYSMFHHESLYHAIRHRPYSQIVELSNAVCRRLSAISGIPLQDTDVLIDAPPLHREVEFRVDVYFRSENCYRPLREVSPVVDAMARTQFDDCVKKVRIFGSQQAIAAASVSSVKVDQLVKDLLTH